MELSDPGLAALDILIPLIVTAEGAEALVLAAAERLAQGQSTLLAAPTLQQALAQITDSGSHPSTAPPSVPETPHLGTPPALLHLGEVLTEREPEYRRLADHIGGRGRALPWLFEADASMLPQLLMGTEGFAAPSKETFLRASTAAEDDEPIIITGERQVDDGTDQLGTTPTGGDPTMGGGDTGQAGGGNGDLPEAPSHEDCQKDAKAREVADTINSAPQDGNERGAVIYKDAEGNIVSTPIAVGAPGTVAVGLPPGVTMSQVIGFIHSHPMAPRSGDAAQDAMYDAADVYPSPSDWDQMDAMVAGGADPNSLSFYVVDKDGAVREYNYSDKAIYDVPEEQLLGLNGATPPPVPAPMTDEGGCS